LTFVEQLLNSGKVERSLNKSFRGIMANARGIDMSDDRKSDGRKTTRSGEVDAVRGVALFGICVVNVPFLAQPFDQLLKRTSGLDAVAQFLVEWLFQGKFFIMFSFLFGWSVVHQAQRMSNADEERLRYLRRVMGLAILGIAHAILVFYGDILLLYAGVALALYPLRQASAGRLMTIAAWSLLIAAASLGALGLMSEPIPALAASHGGYRGTFLDAVWQRVTHDWPMAAVFIALFNGPLVFAAFCAGAAAAKTGFFEHGNAVFERLRAHLPQLFAVGLAINLAYAAAIGGQLGDGVIALAGLTTLAIGSPVLGCAYLVSIVVLYRRGRFGPAMLASGRMSLTCYVLEGIVAGLVFNGYGLRLYETAGPAACLGWALAIFAVTHVLCHMWHVNFGVGPLERLLRGIIGSSVRST
jgi:uncharacterized protein